MLDRPITFDLVLPSLALEAGARLESHLARAFVWERGAEPTLAEARPTVVRRSREAMAAIQSWDGALDPEVPTIVVVHALTGEAQCAGPGGFWEPVIGPGKALDTRRYRVVCVNLLGSCYGSSGPCDEGFPRRTEERAIEVDLSRSKGVRAVPEHAMPATVTTWDQARAILLALDRLGLRRVALATGGSLGGMVTLCLGALAPERFERLAPIAATDAASAWLVAFNQVGRAAILSDPGFPHDVGRGLELARQLAMVTYRAEPGLELAQGREQVGVTRWSPRAPYRMATYLEHHGRKLRARFDALAYLTLTGAMDHHDLGRDPNGEGDSDGWGHRRIRASVLAADIDTDQLFTPAATERYAAALRANGVLVERQTIASPHGHDAFLFEWGALARVLTTALELPAFG
jgi:homoserine O-acetyltransferase